MRPGVPWVSGSCFEWSLSSLLPGTSVCHLKPGQERLWWGCGEEELQTQALGSPLGLLAKRCWVRMKIGLIPQERARSPPSPSSPPDSCPPHLALILALREAFGEIQYLMCQAVGASGYKGPSKASSTLQLCLLSGSPRGYGREVCGIHASPLVVPISQLVSVPDHPIPQFILFGVPLPLPMEKAGLS